MKSYNECFHEQLKIVGIGIFGHCAGYLLVKLFNVQPPQLFSPGYYTHFCFIIMSVVIGGTFVRYMIERFDK